MDSLKGLDLLACAVLILGSGRGDCLCQSGSRGFVRKFFEGLAVPESETVFSKWRRTGNTVRTGRFT